MAELGIPPGRDVLGRDGEALHPLDGSDIWAAENINAKSVYVFLDISAATECISMMMMTLNFLLLVFTLHIVC